MHLASIWPFVWIAVASLLATLAIFARADAPWGPLPIRKTLIGLNLATSTLLIVFALCDGTHDASPPIAYIIALAASVAFCVVVGWPLRKRRGRNGGR